MTTRCDICQLRDGHQKLVLLRCDKCELSVHKECYGMPSYTLKTFTCWACQAIGKSFEIEDRDELGDRRRVLQQSRPTKCALCSVSEGTHAMHPLYDRGGPSGRQIYVDGGLAWAHTLCAFSLSLRSLLFGCSRDGYYDGEDYDSDDGTSKNSELMDDTQEGAEFGPDFAPIHHFVYDRSEKSKEQQKVIKAMKLLRCSICGADDKPEGVLRVCFQCNANDEAEYKNFKGKHPSLSSDETCTLAVHAGCAQWGSSNPSGVQRVYYFPGDDKREPLVNLYCTLHAEDLDNKLQKEKVKSQAEQRQRRRDQMGKPPSPPPSPRNNRANPLKRKILRDLIETVATLRDQDERQKVYTQRKEHWKSKLNGLKKEQFGELWTSVRSNLLDYMADPTLDHRQSARDGSVPIAARSQARTNQTQTNHILETQRQVAENIATQKRGPHTENRSRRTANFTGGAAAKPTGEHSSKRRRKVIIDDDSEEEFELKL